MTEIDVVIPARNPGPFLRETLASVEAQTRRPAEVVVVDDGSDDDIVVESVSGFSLVTLIRQEPLGRSAARNRGAAATDSDFLLFLDADDLLRPDALRILATTLEADPSLDMVHGRVFEFVDHRYPPPPGARSRDAEVFVRQCGSTLLRRSLWDRVGGMDERLYRGEWIDWISRAQQMGAVVAHLDDIVLDRRLHAFNSATPGDDDTLYLKVIRAAILRKRQEQPHE
jgi:glycosyltransferase involved in cell wall biosynthesis